MLILLYFKLCTLATLYNNILTNNKKLFRKEVHKEVYYNKSWLIRRTIKHNVNNFIKSK